MIATLHPRRRCADPGARLRRSTARRRRGRLVPPRERRRRRAVGPILDPRLPPEHELTLLRGGRGSARAGSRRPTSTSPGARDPLEAARTLFQSAAPHGASETRPRASQRLRRLSRVGPCPRHRQGARLGAARHVAARTLLRRRRPSSSSMAVAHGDHRRRRRGRVERARAHLERPSRSRRSRCPTARAFPPASRSTSTTRATRRGPRARRSTSRRATPSRSSSRARSPVPRAGRDPFDVYRAMRVLNPTPVHVLPRPAAGARASARARRSRARARRRWCASRTAR